MGDGGQRGGHVPGGGPGWGPEAGVGARLASPSRRARACVPLHICIHIIYIHIMHYVFYIHVYTCYICINVYACAWWHGCAALQRACVHGRVGGCTRHAMYSQTPAYSRVGHHRRACGRLGSAPLSIPHPLALPSWRAWLPHHTTPRAVVSRCLRSRPRARRASAPGSARRPWRG